MYVTVTRDGTDRLVAHGLYDTPAIDTGNGAVTAAICPPGAVDRTTGILSRPYQYATAAPALAAVPVHAPTATTLLARGDSQ